MPRKPRTIARALKRPQTGLLLEIAVQERPLGLRFLSLMHGLSEAAVVAAMDVLVAQGCATVVEAEVWTSTTLGQDVADVLAGNR